MSEIRHPPCNFSSVFGFRPGLPGPLFKRACSRDLIPISCGGGTRPVAEGSAAAASASGNEMVTVVGMDDSEHSFYSLQWVLSLFFSGGPAAAVAGVAHKLVIVNVRPIALSVIVLTAFGGILYYTQVIDALYEVAEGDPRAVLCEPVEKLHVDLLVVGTDGFGAIKRYVSTVLCNIFCSKLHCKWMVL
ncbi:hypothetical protein AXF42_Ash016460 [Apostasia shenzhenica]|uniref:Uncharacterized protein n=1 Tax=Apostasia shenzhenica TaxID=1088818 RepID=A0A2I0A088_9ASPA|nr:hypothetical protein AXF42_Ash016460 [Apostasia shenzhenica]